MMKRNSVVGLVCCVLAGALGVSCASGVTPRPRLPAEERALLELMPNDAFLGVRVDMRALRATPHWQELEASMVASGAPEDVQRYFRETDRLVAVVGGFVDAPSYPEPDPEAETMVTPPAWVDVAESLHGKLPRAVAIVEGSAAALCDTALEGQQRREVRGYSVGVINGIALLTRERLCVVTLEPVLESLLAQGDSAPADVLGMLAAPGPGDAAPILSYVADYSAPGYAAWVEQHGARARARLEEARERRREQEAAREAAAEGQQGAEGEDPLAGFSDFASRMDEVVNQTIVLFLEVSKITMRGMVSSTMRLSHNDGGYDFRSRVTVSDEDRSIMWRELLRMYLDIARAAVEVYDVPEEPREILMAALRSVSVEDRVDGYEVVARASDRRVSSLIAYGRRTGGELTPSMPDMEGIESPWELISQVDRAAYEVPSETVLSLEPNVERLRGLDDRETRQRGLLALSNAYASLGRYGDAISVLTASIEADRVHVETVDPYLRPDVFTAMCELAAGACNHHLEWGFAEQAREAALSAADTGQTCADVSYRAFTCLQVAESRLGRAEAALAELEGRSPWGDVDVAQFGTARAQVLGALGRWDASYEAARGTCAGPLSASSCPRPFSYALEAMARGSSTLAQHDAAFENIRMSYSGTSSLNVQDDAIASLAAIGDCARRVRLAAREPATLAACTAANQVTTLLHGTAHPRTALAWYFLGMARAAAGDSAGAAAAQQEVEALRPTLGPQHPVNQPAPTPPTGPTRPRRPR